MFRNNKTDNRGDKILPSEAVASAFSQSSWLGVDIR